VGLALAPPDFGFFSGDLLVGNFATARSMPSTPVISTETASIRSVASSTPPDGPPLIIDGLWGLAFGSGSPPAAEEYALLYRRPWCEKHGLFGTLVEPRHLSIRTRIRQLEDSRNARARSP